MDINLAIKRVINKLEDENRKKPDIKLRVWRDELHEILETEIEYKKGFIKAMYIATGEIRKESEIIDDALTELYYNH